MGNKKNQHTKRREFRKKLESWGMDPKEIEKCVDQFKDRQHQKALGQMPIDAPLCTRAEYVRLLRQQEGARPSSTPHLRFGDDYESPDDKGYRPPKVDHVLTGVARATGETAMAVKRGKTITKHQYDNRED